MPNPVQLGLRLNRVVHSHFVNLGLYGQANGHKPLVLDGTNSFTGDNDFTNIRASLDGFSGVTVQLENAANNNHFTNLTVSNSGNVGTGIDASVGGVQGTKIEGLDAEGLATAFNYGSNPAAVQNVCEPCWFEANTVDIAWGTSRNNYVFASSSSSGTGTGPIQTDGGSTGNKAEYTKSPFLNHQGPGSPITVSGTPQTIYTYTLPANTVGPGKGLHLEVFWFHNSGANSATVNINFNATNVFNQLSTGVDSSQREGLILDLNNQSGVQNAQDSHVQNILRTVNVPNVPININDYSFGAKAIDFTQQQVITITVTGANPDQMTGQTFDVINKT